MFESIRNYALAEAQKQLVPRRNDTFTLTGFLGSFWEIVFRGEVYEIFTQASLETQYLCKTPPERFSERIPRFRRSKYDHEKEQWVEVQKILRPYGPEGYIKMWDNYILPFGNGVIIPNDKITRLAYHPWFRPWWSKLYSLVFRIETDIFGVIEDRTKSFKRLHPFVPQLQPMLLSFSGIDGMRIFTKPENYIRMPKKRTVVADALKRGLSLGEEENIFNDIVVGEIETTVHKQLEEMGLDKKLSYAQYKQLANQMINKEKQIKLLESR